MFHIAQNEYNNEHSRIVALDTKMAFMLPLASGYFLTFIPMCPDYAWIFGMTISSFSDFMAPAGLFLTLTTAFLSAFIALLTMLYTVLPRKYKVLNPAGFYKEASMIDDKILATAVTMEYFETTSLNHGQNERRAKCYKRGCYGLVLSIILLLIYTIIKYCCNASI